MYDVEYCYDLYLQAYRFVQGVPLNRETSITMFDCVTKVQTGPKHCCIFLLHVLRSAIIHCTNVLCVD